MKKFMPLLMILSLSCAPLNSLADTQKNNQESMMDGTWTVDLSSTPYEPYFKPMTLDLNADGSVSGTFYDSTIEAGRWKTSRGRTCVSFRTSDGVGDYYTSACLVNNQVEGQTWAIHRNFLFNWNATKQ